MIVLVLNCGSATLKYKLYDANSESLQALAGRTIEVHGGYGEAVRRVVGDLPRRPDAVGHRVVHGGSAFHGPTLIDDRVEGELRRLSELAPLHNPPALEAIVEARRLGVPSVAVFDTSFHRTIPERAWRYALPRALPPEIRRYGFHGLSHEYVTERYAELTGSKAPTLVTLHLGNGCSAAAIEKGVSVDTSMGLSPLEGLVMGTRGGDLDPEILLHLLRKGTPLEALERMLHHEAGLTGLAGTGDMRELLARSDPEAALAIEIFCIRARKYLGAYLAVLGGAEAVVFTGGIGENAPQIRRKIAQGMEWAGLALDPARNEAGEGSISRPDARLAAYVIRTDEELLIARQALPLLMK